MGIWVWYRHSMKFKSALYLMLFFLVSDDIFDFYGHIDDFDSEMIIHDLLFILWGAIAGFLYTRHIHRLRET